VLQIPRPGYGTVGQPRLEGTSEGRPSRFSSSHPQARHSPISAWCPGWGRLTSPRVRCGAVPRVPARGEVAVPTGAVCIASAEGEGGCGSPLPAAGLGVLEQGWPSRPRRTPARPRRALPHLRAVTTSPSHGLASAPSPPSRVPGGEGPRVPRGGQPAAGLLPQRRARLPRPRHRRGCRVFPAHAPLPQAERRIRTWSPGAAGIAAGLGTVQLGGARGLRGSGRGTEGARTLHASPSRGTAGPRAAAGSTSRSGARQPRAGRSSPARGGVPSAAFPGAAGFCFFVSCSSF